MSRTTASFPMHRWYLLRKQTGFADVILDVTPVLQCYTVRSDVAKVPDFRGKIARGEGASTNYSFAGNTLSVTNKATGRPWIFKNGATTYETSFSGCQTNICLDSNSLYPTLNPVLFNLAQAKARSRAVQAIRSKRSEFSGPTFLGEFRESLKMIRRPASALGEGIQGYLKDVQKVRRGLSPVASLKLRSKRLSEAASNLWLEYSFGWKPLIADTLGIAKAIADWETDRASDMFHGFAGDRELIRGRNLQDLTVQLDGLESWVQTIVYGHKYYGKLRAQAQLPAKGTAGRLVEVLGFNMQEFVPTIWELIPFSFVVDYFVNVGEMLSAASTDLSWVEWVSRVQWVFTTHLEQYTVTAKPAWNQFMLKQGNTIAGIAESQRKEMQRFASADLSAIEVQTSWNGTANRYANLGALILQLAKSIKP